LSWTALELICEAEAAMAGQKTHIKADPVALIIRQADSHSPEFEP
jgi:hypothetical protein